MFLQQLVNAVMLGAILALSALGLTLIYSVLRFLNMAHGELIMAGAYTGLVVAVNTGNVLYSFASSIVAIAVLGIVVERFTFRYVRQETHLVPLIMSLGLSTVLTETFRLMFYPARPQPYPLDVQTGVSVGIGNVSVSSAQLIALTIALVTMFLLHQLIFRSSVGKGLRAMSEDLTIARLLGVNDNRMASVTFAIAGALSGVAGVCFGLLYAGVDPYIGSSLGLKGILIVVFAGLGNMYGAMLGGLIFGFVSVMSVVYIAPGWGDFFSYLFVVLILIFKPTGLLGTKYAQPR